MKKLFKKNIFSVISSNKSSYIYLRDVSAQKKQDNFIDFMKIFSFMFFCLILNDSFAKSSNISVLVIDQPIDYSHPDLQVHKPEITPCNLVTGEKYLDKYIADTSVFSNWSHGTHVSGIIQSHLDEESPNHVYIHSGVLFPGDEESDSGNLSIEKIKDQVRREVKNIEEYIRITKPRVVNMSIGESSIQLFISVALAEAFAELDGISKKEAIAKVMKESNKLHDFKKRLMEKMMKKLPGTLFVIAAGNDEKDLDKTDRNHNFNNSTQLLRRAEKGRLKGVHTMYSQIKLPNSLVVGSVDAYKTKRADFSNHSPIYVDIMAEGDKVMSAAPGGDYIEMSGTSMAAPQVSGVAAYYLQQNPDLTTIELKEKILTEASRHLRLRPYVHKGRLLNIPKNNE